VARSTWPPSFDTARRLAAISLRNASLAATTSAISVIKSLSPSRESMSRRPEAGMTPSDFGDLLSPQEHALGLKQTSRISP
jgi:hypothetical protein